METQEGDNKSIFKRFWWIILIILVVIVFFFISQRNDTNDSTKSKNDEYINQDIQPEQLSGSDKLSEEELLMANQAFEKGIKIDDPQNDWYKIPEGSIQRDGRPDNPNTYPFDYTDLKQVQIGADEQNLYFKCEYFGTFPNTTPVYNDDIIEGGICKATDMFHVNSSGENISSEADIYIFYPERLDSRIETNSNQFSNACKVFGGQTFNYLLGSCPLEKLGLKYGDEVIFTIATEVGSVKFHHEAIDNMLQDPNIKFGGYIKYKLGSNTYELTEIDYSKVR